MNVSLSLDHCSLVVGDLGKAIDFYCTAFGFEVLFREDQMSEELRGMTGVAGIGGNIAQLCLYNQQCKLELIEFHPPEDLKRELPDAPINQRQGHVGFSVESLDEQLKVVVELGAVMLGEITEFEECRSCYVKEPSGSVIELTEFYK